MAAAAEPPAAARQPDDGLKVPEATWPAGSFGEIVPSSTLPDPTPADLDSLRQIEAALDVQDPWAGDTPSLHSTAG